MTDAQRLAAYDRLYRELLAERDGVAAKMEALQAEGRTKTATYRQLLTDKLTLQNLIARFAAYGIREDE